MALSEVERNIVGRVVDRFLNSSQATARKTLVIDFEDPESIDRLLNWQLLKTQDNANYLPTALSFHYCGDPQVETLARRAVQLFARLFRNMYLQDKIDFAPDNLRDQMMELYDKTDEQLIRVGLYLAPDFRLLSGWSGGSVQQPDITPTGLNEQVVSIKNVETLWDDYVRQRVPWTVQDSSGGIIPRHAMFESKINTESFESNTSAVTKSNIKVLISHSSKDKALAEALIDLLRSGLGLLANQIRCTSVEGYRLPAGANTHDQLRSEIRTAAVVIGLLTSHSVSSAYVLFELGARWGANLFMIPLLADIKPEEMRGPHGVLNALSCETEPQLIQLVEDIGRELQIPHQSAAAYLTQVRAVMALAKSVAVREPQNLMGISSQGAPQSFTISIKTGGLPPRQVLKLEATHEITVSRLEYMLSDEACIEEEALSLRGKTVDVPLSHDKLTKILNTPRADMNRHDLSGPMKFGVTLSSAGKTLQYVLPVRLQNSANGNTYYREVKGSKTFHVST